MLISVEFPMWRVVPCTVHTLLCASSKMSYDLIARYGFTRDKRWVTICNKKWFHDYMTGVYVYVNVCVWERQALSVCVCVCLSESVHLKVRELCKSDGKYEV